MAACIPFANLTDALPEHLMKMYECPVCFEVVGEPVMCSNQHVIGAACWPGATNECPCCRVQGTPVPCRYLRNQIEGLHFRCTHGCGAVFVQGQLANHEKACPSNTTPTQPPPPSVAAPKQKKVHRCLGSWLQRPEPAPEPTPSGPSEPAPAAAPPSQHTGVNPTSLASPVDPALRGSVPMALSPPIASGEVGVLGTAAEAAACHTPLPSGGPAGVTGSASQSSPWDQTPSQTTAPTSAVASGAPAKVEGKSALAPEVRRRIDEKKRLAKVKQLISKTDAVKRQRSKLEAAGKENLQRMGLLPNNPAAGPSVATVAKATGQLSKKQREVLQLVMDGHNCFITGPAGVGKSFLIRSIISALENRGKTVALTAPTGIAAVNIGGMTIHSWAGIGLGEKPARAYVDKLRGSLSRALSRDQDTPATRWVGTDALIIDEISMLSAGLFSKLDDIGRKMRNYGKNQHLPFGGLQIIVTGDFFQLPPVPEKEPRCPICGKFGGQRTVDRLHPHEVVCVDAKVGNGITPGCGTKWSKITRFAFENDPLGRNKWEECMFKFCELSDVFRQTNPRFISLLHRARLNVLNADDFKLLDRCRAPLDISDGIVPTKLYPHNNSVDAENLRNYNAIQAEERQYRAFDGCNESGKYLLSSLQKNPQAQEIVKLKIGAQVILLSNLNVGGGLCNGTRGVITWFADMRKPEDRFEVAYREDDNELVRDFVLQNPILPVVAFATNDGIRNQLIVPNNWTATRDAQMAFRVQIPLRLAWAITIHKSQGMTLNRVEMALGAAFAEGQAYVALSRVTSLEGLELTSFDKSSILASPLVLEFYRKHGSLTVFEADPEDEDVALEMEESPEQKVGRLQAEAKAEGRFIDLTDGDDATDEAGPSMPGPVKLEAGTTVKSEPGSIAPAIGPAASISANMTEDAVLTMVQDDMMALIEDDEIEAASQAEAEASQAEAEAACAAEPMSLDSEPMVETEEPTDTKPRRLSRKSSYVAYLERAGPTRVGERPFPVGEENCLMGLRFVITGVLEFMEREHAEELVRKYGGKVQSNPAGNTDYVVVGREPGPKKMQKVKKLGTQCLTEDEFCNLIEGTAVEGEEAEEDDLEQEEGDASTAPRKRRSTRASSAVGKYQRV